ncbi:MAG: hypothetical protein ACLFST_09975 [Spirochaetia bacterium]
MKAVIIRVLPLFLLVVLSGCEQVFTFSPLSGLKRDPANLSDDQKREYAKDALESSDDEAAKEAFELLKDSEDPEDQSLAVDLAIEASGVTDAILTLLTETDSSDPDALLETVNASLEDLDLDILSESADILTALGDAEGGEPTVEQYVLTGAGLVLLAAQDAGGVENLTGDSAQEQQAEELLTDAQELYEAGGDTGGLESLGIDLSEGIDGLF